MKEILDEEVQFQYTSPVIDKSPSSESMGCCVSITIVPPTKAPLLPISFPVPKVMNVLLESRFNAASLRVRLAPVSIVKLPTKKCPDSFNDSPRTTWFPEVITQSPFGIAGKASS